jgi:putative ABC transport system permease protein
MEGWIMDLRYSARRLASRPAYALLAVLTLSLGAGGTAAVFSVARTLLLDPLPVANGSQLGVFWTPGDWNEAEFLHLRPDFPGFQRVAAIRPMDSTLEMPGAPLRLVRGIGTSAELFDVLGTGTLLGRGFEPGDDMPGAEPAAMLSYGLWQELGADPDIVGRQLMLGGVPRRVVGVMPRGFWFPNPAVRVWTTQTLNPQNQSGNYALVGRVVDGARVDRMETPLAAITASLRERFQYPPQWDKTTTLHSCGPGRPAGWCSPSIIPLREFLVGNVRPALLATLGAMALILLIACVNVAALMLAQVSGRNNELAVRAALGAGRRRLLQQLVAESLLVGLVAGCAGALLAAAGFEVLVRSLPLGALAETAALDWTVFTAAIAIALGSAVAVVLVPGLALWRGNLSGSMTSSRTGAVSVLGGRLDSCLVVAQVGLAVLLLSGAGLLLRSVTNLRAIDPGFPVSRLAVIDATVPTRLSNDERRRAVLDFLPSLQALPNVRAAAATLKLPLRGAGQDWGISIDGKPDLPASTTYFRIVTHDYFRALGVEIRRGRGFVQADREGTQRVVVINEALVARYFPGEDPIGRVIHTGFDERGEIVIGVVGNIAEAGLTDGPVAARYMLYDQVPDMWHEATFVIAANSAAQVPSVLESARATLDLEGRRLALQQATTMEAVFEQAVGTARHVATLVALLAGLALLLSAIGVYGVISHFVARRTRDYGVQIALGLSPARVVSQVVRRGTVLAGFGGAAGVLAALLLTRLLSSLLYGVGAADPVALAVAVGSLLLAGSLAALVPAWRAGRTDPASLLRQE